MDDIRPPQQRGSRPPGHGRPPSGSGGQYPNSMGQSNPSYQPEQSYSAQDHNNLPQSQEDYSLEQPKKKKGKGKTFALILFILLFLGAAGAAGWFYYQNMELQKQVDEQNTEIQRLEGVIYQLRYDIRDYANKQDLSDADKQALQKYADDLKAACGATCDSISQ